MNTRTNILFISLVATCFWLSGHEQAFSASLPKSTEEILGKLKVSPSILSDIDKELQVPRDWVEKARKEGKVILRSSPTGAQVSAAPFRERYPFINLEVSGSNLEDRAVKTLMAYKTGRVIADVVESAGDALFEFKKNGALADLRDIPAMANLLDTAKDPEGLWVAHSMHVWCMAYNTKLVKTADLPKTWDDLLTHPAWRNMNLALANRPGNWVASLWKAKGEEWTKRFLNKLFTEVKPQRRKEGLGTLPSLAASGEFHAVIPASQSITYQTTVKGAPVSLHCPEPVPANLSEVIMLKGSPNTYAAKIYLNWALSKEGQLARQVDYYASVHKGLQAKEFIRFAETIFGKEKSFVDLNDEQQLMPTIMEAWTPLWTK